MRITKIAFLVVLFLSFGSTKGFSQTTNEELIRRAKEMGITEEMIQSRMKLQSMPGMQPVQNIPAARQSMVMDPNDRERYILEELIKDEQNRQDSLAALVDITKTVFGSEIFMNRNLTFEPNYNIATPLDYQLGAGDQIFIDIWGDSEANYQVTISPDGNVYIPNAGLIPLSGMTIEEAEKRLKVKLSEIYSGLNEASRPVEIKVSLAQIRSIQVNIVGEVTAPGTYRLPSLSSVFNALYMAGGINEIGSLRNIKVYRNNRLVGTLDVYEYLISGKTASNIRLQDNDVILVPPYENHVMINGKIKRNRIFEMKAGETLQNLITYAGGFTGDAYTDNIQVNRKQNGEYRIHTVEKDNFSGFQLSGGDSISVRPSVQMFVNRVTIRGAVWFPGEYELSPRTHTVGSLIKEAKGLKGDAFTARGQITRLREDFTYEVLPLDIRGILRGDIPDISLQNEDEIYIPSIYDLKEKQYILVRGEVNKAPLSDSLLITSSFDFTTLSATQAVRTTSDTIPYRENMTLEDAILLAGGLKESASEAKVLVARRIKNPGTTSFATKIAEEFEFRINKDLSMDASSTDFILMPFDEVYVRRSPGYQEQQIVRVEGEVLFPGEYVLSSRNVKLTDLIDKTGGITPDAYVKGAHLTRRKTLSDLAREETLLRISQASLSSRDTLSYSQLKTDSMMMVGIDLEKAINNPESEYNILVQEGDVLVIPQKSYTVKINGAVLYPNVATYNKKAKLNDYISQAGGYVQRARKKPYVIYMNGQVAATRGGFLGKRYPKIEPGCEIVVPMKAPARGMSTAEIMSLGSSTASIAAMLTTILR